MKIPKEQKKAETIAWSVALVIIVTMYLINIIF